MNKSCLKINLSEQKRKFVQKTEKKREIEQVNKEVRLSECMRNYAQRRECGGSF